MNTSQHLARLGYPGEVGWRLLPADPRLVRNTIPAATVGVYLLIADRQIVYVGRSDTCLQGRLYHHEHFSAARIIA